jgi:hypothetical protein
MPRIGTAKLHGYCNSKDLRNGNPDFKGSPRQLAPVLRAVSKVTAVVVAVIRAVFAV